MVRLIMFFWGFIFFGLFRFIDFLFFRKNLLGQIIVVGVIIMFVLSFGR